MSPPMNRAPDYPRQGTPDNPRRDAPDDSGRAALVTLSLEGAHLARVLLRHPSFADASLFVQEEVDPFPDGAVPFARIVKWTAQTWGTWRRILYITPCGVAIRSIAPHLEDKYHDPAVICTDIHGRWVISLVSGHEGGANRFAGEVANLLGAEPVITTTTETQKRLVVGVGCRRGVAGDVILHAIRQTLEDAGLLIGDIRSLATVEAKAGERGIHEAAAALGCPVRILPLDAIRQVADGYAGSDFVKGAVGVPCVAEPAAMLGGRRTRLRIPRKAIHGVTVAVAEEGCVWSALVPEA